jgi:hypothetical protein
MIRPINYEKYNLFKQLNIKIDSSVELMLNDLIFKYSFTKLFNQIIESTGLSVNFIKNVFMLRRKILKKKKIIILFFRIFIIGFNF